MSDKKSQGRRRQPDDAPQRLYAALVKADAATAVGVLQQSVADGSPHSQVFDSTLAPALALVGEAWAKREIGDEGFQKASEIVEQLLSFAATPAPETDAAVVVGTLRGDAHSVGKNVIAAVLRDAGYRVTDLGRDVRPVEFLERVESSQAKVVVACAQTLSSARRAEELRSVLDSGGHREVLLVVSGGPFTGDLAFARSLGANGVIVGASSALRVMERVCSRLGAVDAS